MDYQWLARQAYQPMWKVLQERATAVRLGDAQEIVWACEHEPIYTTGRRGVDNRLGLKIDVPMIQTDRGGETTFHGPGQVMLYPVISLRQRAISVRDYVSLLEQSAIDVLQLYAVRAERRCGLPGVWTEHGKIAAIGIRVAGGVAYHGMALNMHVDLSYFAAINPCGTGQRTASLQQYNNIHTPLDKLAVRWNDIFQKLLKIS